MHKLFPLLLLILIVAACSHVVNCSVCPKGYFATQNIEQICHVCDYGTYCPGDDHSYVCQDGAIAPQQGQSTCNTCDSGRSNSARILCLLKGTPSDAIEIFTDRYGSPTPFIVSKSTFVYTTLSMPYSTNLNYTLQITFNGPDMDSQLLLYASTKTGSPSAANYEFFGNGLNATLSLPQSIGSQFIIYFNLQAPSSQFRLKYYAKSFLSYPYVNDINSGHFEMYHPFIFQNWMTFKKDNVPEGTTIGVKVRLLNDPSLGNNNQPVDILYSSNPFIVNLNPNNANLVVRGTDNQYITAVFKQTKSGPFVFGIVAEFYLRTVQVDLY
ncbi:predicted protein [Naegleria gruberi]|uniref:Predicted protein n=1 Tax=Naegleria gruberi TaxID=5762 RepID=D2W0I0_NAEGR|nr:uncharacterized protein NAEGRDRAFT_74866 [Naegleria gruberi]EFC37482.1 predicted protein [Naegleria gruberi]|eukprot:XP_002670226.1 predicted protein [Naegleria gruberi strain NEG-M]